MTQVRETLKEKPLPHAGRTLSLSSSSLSLSLSLYSFIASNNSTLFLLLQLTLVLTVSLAFFRSMIWYKDIDEGERKRSQAVRMLKNREMFCIGEKKRQRKKAKNISRISLEFDSPIKKNRKESEISHVNTICRKEKGERGVIEPTFFANNFFSSFFFCHRGSSRARNSIWIAKRG